MAFCLVSVCKEGAFFWARELSEKEGRPPNDATDRSLTAHAG